MAHRRAAATIADSSSRDSLLVAPAAVAGVMPSRQDARRRHAATGPVRCPRRLGRCRCTQPAGHVVAVPATGHVYVHSSSAPDRKAD